MLNAAIISAAMALLPSHYEQGDFRPIAEAIAAVAADKAEAAAMISLGWHETKFSRLVLEGRCHELPAGMRCDGGRALGPWQLHQAACPSAWVLATPTSSPEAQIASLPAQARCVVTLLRWGARRYGRSVEPLLGAFGAYSTQGWQWSGAAARARTVGLVLKRWPHGA